MLAELRVKPILQPCAIGTIVQRHEGLGHLAVIGIGNANHDRLLHGRIPIQHSLDLTGEDFEPADRDHVLQPVDDPDIAIVIDRRDIAAAQEAIDKRVGVGATPVALHHLWTGENKLAGFTIGSRLGRVFAVDELYDCALHRLSDGARFVNAVIGIAGDDARTFSQPIAFDHARAGGAFEFGLERRCQRRPTRDAHVEALE